MIYADFESLLVSEDNRSTKCWICNNDYVDNDVKVRDHCHITGKIYRLCA